MQPALHTKPSRGMRRLQRHWNCPDFMDQAQIALDDDHLRTIDDHLLRLLLTYGVVIV
jgi:hypothetical protein